MKEALKKNYKKVLSILVVVILLVLGLINNELTTEEPPKKIINKTSQMFEVEIIGNVRYPGKYNVYDGSTIDDLIDLSGGVFEDSETSFINLSKMLEKDEIIIVPKKSTNIKNRICINTAPCEQLMKLSGIGEDLANKIIIYRITYGPFNKIEDLLKVEGLKAKVLNNIINEIYL